MDPHEFEFEISARHATWMLARAGLNGVVVDRPTDLAGLLRLVGRILPSHGDRSRRGRIGASLYGSAAALKEALEAAGEPLRRLGVHALLDFGAVAAALSGGVRRPGQREAYAGWVVRQLETLNDLALAAGVDDRLVGHSFRQLMSSDQDLVRNLLTAVAAGNADWALNSLLDYRPQPGVPVGDVEAGLRDF